MNTPFGIAGGSDGAVWFTNRGNASIGRITTAGVVTNYTDPTLGNVTGMVAGPDGALWFTDTNSASIGRITTSGHVTRFTDHSIVSPDEITVGPDGALWFTNDNGTVGRITTSGTVTSTHFAKVAPVNGVGTGPDGAVWVTRASLTQGSISRITTTGTVTTYTDPGILDPNGITAGPDGAMWFTNGNSIGRITVPPPVIVPRSASIAEGNSGTTNLMVPVTLSYPSTQTVSAQWRTVFAPHGAGAQADPATDYTAATGTVTFAPGQVTQTITITISINGDTLVEPDEYLVVAFHDPTNATIGGLYGLGVGFITNDD